jgi:hypothetical protein
MSFFVVCPLCVVGAVAAASGALSGFSIKAFNLYNEGSDDFYLYSGIGAAGVYILYSPMTKLLSMSSSFINPKHAGLAIGAVGLAANLYWNYAGDIAVHPIKVSPMKDGAGISECINSYCKDVDPDNKKIVEVKNSTIWGFGGSTNFSGNDNTVEKYFFSLCTTKPTSQNTINRIDRFNDKEDSLHFFCSKTKINKEDVSIEYNKAENTTFVKVNDMYRVALGGEHDTKGEYIHLNGNFTGLVETKGVGVIDIG